MLSIPTYQTIVQHMTLETSNVQDVPPLVQMYLQQRMNVEPRRMVIRHFVVDTEQSRNGKQEVICLAAPRDIVMRYIDIARRCKLEVVGMHSELLCMLRAFAHVYANADDQERVCCFIDIGSATTKVLIAHGMQVVFAKSIHAAGDQITRRMANHRHIEFADARQLRMAANAELDQPTIGMGEHHAAVSETATATATLARPAPATRPGDDCAHETLECLVDELRLCVRYYASLFPQRPIERVVFLGGESRNLQICRTLAQSLNLPAQLGDPFARLTRIGKAKAPTGVDLNLPQPGWAVPMGLCLSEANL